MSSINGFHSPSVSTACNETSKRLPSTSSTSSTSSNSTMVMNKRIKSKIATTIITETRTMKKHGNKMNKKRYHHHHRHHQNDSNNNSTKKVAESTHFLTHPIIHHQKKSSSQTENIPSINSHSHHHHHRQQQQQQQQNVINNEHCDSCGEEYGEMISCDTCPATFHLLCANPPLSREDIPKGSYFCENCRAKTTEVISSPKTVLTDSKKKITTNGLKKNPPRQTTLTQLKLPTASNGRSLIQPSGEIKFRATSNTVKSNLKRKRIDSTSSSSQPLTNHLNHSHTVKIPTTQIETLRRLLISCRPEEFRGPTLPFDDPTYNRENFFQKNSLSWQKYCFICRKSTNNHLPSIHCDYCPLTYHLDCLTPPMTSLPSIVEKWMCPNHIEPILDRYLMKKKIYSTSERVKIYRQYAEIEHKTILQEFARMRKTRNDLLTKTRDQQRLQRIDISQIPKVIEQFYLNANIAYQQIDEEQESDSDDIEEECVQTYISPEQSISNYDSCIWDLLQSILDNIVDGREYEYSSIMDCSLPIEKKSISTTAIESNVVDRIDRLLNVLNEPNYSPATKSSNNDAFTALLAAADLSYNDEKHSSDIPNSLTHSFSLLIDLSQFRSSHAALIHMRSKHVIYIRKHVVWFGSAKSNDICLKSFNPEQTCQYVSERHACLYYDRKRNLFELLNYSEYGTIVNGLRYGLGKLSDDDDDEEEEEEDSTKIENENLQKCFCLTNPLYHSAWDGPAQLEQGTVVQIGCHKFLFYRHVVR